MKLLRLIFILNISLLAFGQSKKEQVEFLTNQIDSLNNVIGNNNIKFSIKSKQVDSLLQCSFFKEQIILSKHKTIDSISELAIEYKSSISQLNVKLEEISSQKLILENSVMNLNTTIDSLQRIITRNQRNLNNDSIVFFTSETLKNVSGQDARSLSNNEVKINFYIGDYLTDSYFDFGSGEFSSEDLSYYLQSDLSQKTYQIKKNNNSTYSVTLTLFFEGEERVLWEKQYVLDANYLWIKSNCKGDCD
jgi:hypothetical protein